MSPNAGEQPPGGGLLTVNIVRFVGSGFYMLAQFKTWRKHVNVHWQGS